MLTITRFKPASSPSRLSKMRVSYPRFSAQRRYIRNNISAQS